MAAENTHYDVLIVGAGIQGLSCAHTFLKIDPTLKILILDDKKSVGGVWAKEQLYSFLRANNLQGYYEFPDFPITKADVGVTERGVLTGESIHAYITKFADHFDLRRLIRLETEIVRATENEGDGKEAWTLQISSHGVESQLTCSKLIIATGHASRPWIPSVIADQTEYKQPIIHTQRLSSQGVAISQDPAVKHVTVIGGGKSAYDAVYLFHKAGKQVTWFMRQDGRGGMPISKTYLKFTFLNIWAEYLLMSRQISWLGACPWSDGDGFRWIRSFLHRTSFGRWLGRALIAQVDSRLLKQSGVLGSRKTSNLVPAASLQWYGTQASQLTYEDDFYQMIEDERIEIVKGDLEGLVAEGLMVREGQDEKARLVRTDAVVCATGYNHRPSLSIEPQEKRLGWGMPVPLAQDEASSTLNLQADAELLKRFPGLLNRPEVPARQSTGGTTPWRLWRSMAPPSQTTRGRRSLVFLCAVTSYQMCIKNEISSLWTYAYLFDRLDARPESEEKAMYEAILWSRFGRWQRPMGMQGKHTDLLMDSFPYYDLLLRDLGLRGWRRGGYFAELFASPYKLQDYGGLVEEWIGKHRVAGKRTASESLQSSAEDSC